MTLDVRLMPGLAKACRLDMSKFCHEVTNNDQVIPCLKKNIKVRKIVRALLGQWIIQLKVKMCETVEVMCKCGLHKTILWLPIKIVKYFSLALRTISFVGD